MIKSSQMTGNIIKEANAYIFYDNTEDEIKASAVHVQLGARQ